MRPTGLSAEHAGLHLLEHPAEYPGLALLMPPRVLLRVWRYPSFEPWCSWAVLEADGSLFLRRIAWDHRRLVISDPITYGSEVLIERSTFDSLSSELHDIELMPFAPVSTLGIDGTTYGVEVGDFGVSARLSWWASPPADWVPVQEWHERAVALFESLLPAQTTSLGPP